MRRRVLTSVPPSAICVPVMMTLPDAVALRRVRSEEPTNSAGLVAAVARETGAVRRVGSRSGRGEKSSLRSSQTSVLVSRVLLPLACTLPRKCAKPARLSKCMASAQVTVMSMAWLPALARPGRAVDWV